MNHTPKIIEDAVDRGEYLRIHNWLRTNYGSPKVCEGDKCSGISDAFDWAVKRGMEHKRNREHYLRLCRSCHLKYDWNVEKGKRFWEIGHTDEANEKRRIAGLKRRHSEASKQKEIKTKRAIAKKYCLDVDCLCLSEWSERFDVSVGTLYARIHSYGMTLEEALNKELWQPLRK